MRLRRRKILRLPNQTKDFQSALIRGNLLWRLIRCICRPIAVTADASAALMIAVSRSCSTRFLIGAGI